MGVESVLSLQPHSVYASLLAHAPPSLLLRRLCVRAGSPPSPDRGSGGRRRSFGGGGAAGSGSWCGESHRLDGEHESTRPVPPSESNPVTVRVNVGNGGSGVGLPISLRMLKRKQQQKKQKAAATVPDAEAAASQRGQWNKMGNSLLNAFSSMVFMVRTLQSHSLQFRQRFRQQQQEIDGLLRQVHRDLHASFLWLFQQVFSSTPQLMILLMILLADFTAASMATNLLLPSPPLPSPDSPLPIATAGPSSSSGSTVHLRDGLAFRFPSPSHSLSPAVADGDDGSVPYGDGGFIGNGGRRRSVAGGEDGGGTPDRDTPIGVSTAVYSTADLSSVAAAPPQDLGTANMQSLQADGSSSAGSAPESSSVLTSSSSASEAAFEELSNGSDVGAVDDRIPNLAAATLDQEIMKSLVAPFSVSVEEDDRYACYGRTDLSYQYAISNDSDNAMLLANYAQFLFLVRKDYDRAEELFRRAMRCDPSDGSAAARFAAFMWIARRDAAAAEAAHVAAIRADPANSFNAANYAHFLWSTGQ